MATSFKDAFDKARSNLIVEPIKDKISQLSSSSNRQANPVHAPKKSDADVISGELYQRRTDVPKNVETVVKTVPPSHPKVQESRQVQIGRAHV